MFLIRLIVILTIFRIATLNAMDEPGAQTPHPAYIIKVSSKEALTLFPARIEWLENHQMQQDQEGRAMLERAAHEQEIAEQRILTNDRLREKKTREDAEQKALKQKEEEKFISAFNLDKR